jgi:ATP-dependent DNA helicase DinG
MSLYPKMPYAVMPKMPIVVATSSIALQKAIMTEYIPELSNILIESGVIRKPLTAVLRKGKEHYICERKLRAHLKFESSTIAKRTLESLLLPSATIDLSEVDVTPHVKRKISVSGRCFDTCPYRETCQYNDFRNKTQSPDIDIQVCNHNYLLADTLLRANGKQPLIPNYQILIVDEAHKFLQAARTMYGVEFSSAAAPEVLNTIEQLTFKREGFQQTTRQMAKKLSTESARLFRALADSAERSDEDTERFAAVIEKDETRHLRNIRALADRLTFVLRDEAFYMKAEELLAWVRNKYGVNTEQIDLARILADNTASQGYLRFGRNKTMRGNRETAQTATEFRLSSRMPIRAARYRKDI